MQGSDNSGKAGDHGPLTTERAKDLNQYLFKPRIPREAFKLDFVSFGGQLALFSVDVHLERYQEGYHDCIDVIEKFFVHFTRMVEVQMNSTICYSQIRRNNEISALPYGYTYTPHFMSTHPNQKEIRLREMWFETGKSALKKMRLKIESGDETGCEYLGIVTPDNIKKVFK